MAFSSGRCTYADSICNGSAAERSPCPNARHRGCRNAGNRCCQLGVAQVQQRHRFQAGSAAAPPAMARTPAADQALPPDRWRQRRRPTEDRSRCHRNPKPRTRPASAKPGAAAAASVPRSRSASRQTPPRPWWPPCVKGVCNSRAPTTNAIKAHKFLCDAVVLSDDAGQFNVGQHALCWVHAERLVHKLDTFTDKHRAAQTRLRGLIWDYYADLKAYRLKPSPRRAAALRTRFDRIFLRRTGFVTLDRLLKRLHANKAELLMVLGRPETPLHTNGSENDIRCYVTRRKLSAGTRSDVGRDCRDAFLGLAKTCDKLGIAVWDYLGSRLKVAGHVIVQPLDRYVRGRFRPA